ncbi:DUF1559 domain-containing protein [Schlesneria sp. T3-172]|uniref:DUF1559 family PulG-like putative transporter n=1 Tax=Schlesneria sphaerica TaxID=3373610 RepID=UPI0037CB97C7
MTANYRIPGAPLNRRGMTVVELLVAIAMIGLLLCILLPAVQMARSSSRRLHCSNNLRQLVLGCALYHDSFSVFPPLRRISSVTSCGEATVFSRLFPYVEVPDLCQLEESETQHIPQFECPADGDLRSAPKPLSYTANASPGDGSGSSLRSPFNSFELVSARDITDGLSSTAGISEDIVVRSKGTRSEGTRQPVKHAWYVSVPDVSDATRMNPGSPAAIAERAAQTESSVQGCVSGPRDFVNLGSPSIGRWAGHWGSGAQYSHWLPPNAPYCIVSDSLSDPNVFLVHNRRAASSHTGGVNVGYMDGHVRFISDKIAQEAWRSMGTRNGNETVNID